MTRNFALAEKQYSVLYSVRWCLYRPDDNVKWLYEHTQTRKSNLAVLLTNMTAWPDYNTHSFLAVGIVNGEVVHHLGVYHCHGFNWHLVIRLIPHWSLQCDNGAVALYFYSHQWWPETSYKTGQNRSISQKI